MFSRFLRYATTLVLCTALLTAVEVFAQQTPAGAPATGQAPSGGTGQVAPGGTGAAPSSGPRQGIILYQPPKLGAPGARIGGGTRAPGTKLPTVLALVPDHLGLTTEKQPTLYWFLSEPTTSPIEFTLNDEKSGKTILQLKLGAQDRSGIHGVSLSQHGVSLAPQKEYRWFVTIDVDPNNPSRNVFSGGSIMYVESNGNLKERLRRSSKTEIPAVYAQEGIWYDAFETLSRLIQENPGDRRLREQRAGLLEQVGLTEAAIKEK